MRRRRVAACSIALTALAAASLHAQVLRGTVRIQGTDIVVSGVRISAMDSLGLTLLEVVSDDRGRFTLALNTAKPFRIAARKVGLQPAFSEFLSPSRTDTLEVDLPIPAVPADGSVLPAVEVAGAAGSTPNLRAYEDAVRHGWKVYGPAQVAERRDKYRDFSDMLRGMQVSGVRIGKPGECIQSMRFMNRCLAVIVDDQPAGPYFIVVPTDIYFFAVLSATESSVRWGDKAPWGAIAIYTRMYGDVQKP